MRPEFAILFAAVIVLGVVGGQVMQMVLKELLPLLRTLVQERQARVGGTSSQELLGDLKAISARMKRIEEDHERLTEANAFLQRLLDDRLQPASLPNSATSPESGESGSGPRSGVRRAGQWPE